MIHSSLKIALEPPDEGLSDSKEYLINNCKQHAISQGYAIAKDGGGDSRKVNLKCDRGGSYESQSVSLRKTSSRRDGGPFKLYGSATKVDNGIWRLTVKNGDHSHKASEFMQAHPSARPSARRLNNIGKQLVQQTNASHVPSKVITTAIRSANPGSSSHC